MESSEAQKKSRLLDAMEEIYCTNAPCVQSWNKKPTKLHMESGVRRPVVGDQNKGSSHNAPSLLPPHLHPRRGRIHQGEPIVRAHRGRASPSRARPRDGPPPNMCRGTGIPPYLYLGTVGGIGTLHAQSSFPPHTGNKEGRGGRRTTSFFAGPGKAEKETPPPIDRIIVK